MGLKLRDVIVCGLIFCVGGMANGQADVKARWLLPIDDSVKKLPLDWQSMSATESQKLIQLPEGYVAELIAQEPMVIDPVAINWGPDGKIWVVEMADYPLGMDGHGSPGSRVRFLEDTDGDGLPDESTLFLDGLTFANSVTPWRKGVIITCAPLIIYAEDTDGDGKADYQKTLYDGFMEGNPQLRINGLRYGIDNWLYCANGLQSKGKVRSVESGEAIEMSGRDFRIRPDTNRIEALEGPTEFARVMDDAGNWYGNDNSNPLWHYALEDRYMKRNKFAAPPDSRVQMIPPRNPPIWPVSKLQMRFNIDTQANRITSACGISIYRDALLFGAKELGGAVQGFTCEPVHNMVMRIVAEPEGATFKGSRAAGEEEKEFLASTDAWFRPVMTRTGADGALWLVDMYRYTVEHPQYMNEAWRSKLHLRAGDDLGRLYRIYHKDRPPRAVPRLDQMDTKGLVGALEDESGTVRDLAQQMLIWKDDRAATPLLEKKLATGDNARGRLHAMGALSGMGRLSDEALIGAMGDANGAVRRFALRFAEERGGKKLIAAAAQLVNDPDGKVRLQLACTLGQWEGDVAGKALARIARSDAGDTYITAAVASSAVTHQGAIADAVLAANGAGGAPPLGMLNNLLAMAAAGKDDAAAARLLSRVLAESKGGYEAWQFDAYVRWLESASRYKANAKPKGAGVVGVVGVATDATKLLAAARRLAADNAAMGADRTAAARLLGLDRVHRDTNVAILTGMLTSQTPTEAQVAAVSSLAKIGGVDLHDVLLKDWGRHGPGVRIAIQGRVLSGTPATLKTLKMVESGALVGFDVDFMKRRSLFRSSNKEIKSLAMKVFKDTDDRPRSQLVKDWSGALKLDSDEARGAAVFATACASCHRVGGVGQNIGPDLRSVSERSHAALLTSIIDPNQSVEPRYMAYTAMLRGNDAAYGIVTAETGTSVTLVGIDGAPRTVLRADLQSLQSTNMSLMPEGLETQMTRQQMADLIRYLGYPVTATSTHDPNAK